MDGLFEGERQPLAARMRPRTLAEFIGQDQIVGPGRLLRRAIESDQLSSIILSGPPGTGKTTLARVIANTTRSQFLSISAVLGGVKEIRRSIDEAAEYRNRTNRRTILFVDEVHRWNKSQQDALLPWVEEGLIILIGATTENPWFEVNRALLSRSRVFLLVQLSDSDLDSILESALADPIRGYGGRSIVIEKAARDHLIATASGDARTLLNALELAVEGGGATDDESVLIDLQTAEDSIQRGALLYDKDGDYHFDTISAFIKSLRGSDPDAALYWLARMVRAGEDPKYIFRRMLVSASEDIGLADPQAIAVVTACAAAFDRVGLPEGQFHLAQAALYLAGAEKSNSTLGYFDALAAIEKESRPEVPTHLRDSNRDGADLGHGAGYLYPHAYRDHWVAQAYLPNELAGRVFYQPGSAGWEGDRQTVLADRRRQVLLLEDEDATDVWAVNGERSDGAQWIHRLRARITDEVRELTDALVSRLGARSTDRVLLFGDLVASLVPVVAAVAAGGLTAAWTNRRVADRLEAVYAESPADDILRPQVVALALGEIPSPPLHAGPFDRLLYRDTTPRDPDTVLSSLIPLLDRDGVLLIVETEPLEGTRPSSLPSLDKDLAAKTEEIEQKMYQPRAREWRRVIDNAGLGEQAEFGEIETSAARSVDERILRRWFGPDGPYATHDPATTSLVLEQTLRSAATSIDWRRVSTTIRITVSEPARS